MMIDSENRGAVVYQIFMNGLFGSLQVRKETAVTDSYARHMKVLNKIHKTKSTDVISDPEKLHQIIVQKARDDGGAHQAYVHFKHVAQSNNGLLKLDGFRRGLRASGINATDKTSKVLFDKLDTSGDGVLSYQELVVALVGDDTLLSGQYLAKIREDWKQQKLFAEAQKRARQQEVVAQRFAENEDPIAVLKDYLESKLSKHNILVSFKRFRRDAGASGNAITESEFGRLLKLCGLDLKPSAVTKNFKRLDTNGDGYITYDEFCALMFSSNAISINRNKRTGLKKQGLTDYVLPEISQRCQTMRQASSTVTNLKDLVWTIKTCVFDDQLNFKILIAEQAPIVESNALSQSNDAKRPRMTVSIHRIEQLMSAKRGVNSTFSKSVLAQLVTTVAKHGRSVGVPPTALAFAAKNKSAGVMDLWTLVHYLYLHAPQHKQKRIEKWDCQQRAADIQRMIERLQGRNDLWRIQPRHLQQSIKEAIVMFRKKFGSKRQVSLEAQRAACQKIFDRIQKSAGGNLSSQGIDLVQFQTAIFHAGMILDREECTALFNHFDTNGNGFLDVREFLGAVIGSNNDYGRYVPQRKTSHKKALKRVAVKLVKQTLKKLFCNGHSNGENFMNFQQALQRGCGDELLMDERDTKVMLDWLFPSSTFEAVSEEVIRRVSQELAPNNRVDEDSFARFALDTKESHLSSVENTPSAKVEMLAESKYNTSDLSKTNANFTDAQVNAPSQSVEQLFYRIKKLAMLSGSTLRLFSSFKTDSAGNAASINFADFRAALLQRHKLQASDKLLKDLFNMLDLNGNGKIDLEEFIHCFAAPNGFLNLQAQRHAKLRAVGAKIPNLNLSITNKKARDRPKTSSKYLRRDASIALRHATLKRNIRTSQSRKR
jgi:Ca2+-binding EF-hand superfamily protein